MTITTEVPSPPKNQEPEVLFPEARRRRRRIRFVVLAVVLSLVVGAAGLIYGITNSGGSPPSSLVASTAPSQISAATVLQDSLAIGTAHESWRTITSSPGCSPPVSGSGVIDLAHARSAVTVTSPECVSLGEKPRRDSYRMVQIGDTSYRTRRPGETWRFGAGKAWLMTPSSGANALISAEPLNVLKGVSSGPFIRIGTQTLGSTATTEYVDAGSLASMEAVTGGLATVGSPEPTLKQIPITVTIWIDAEHRVRQVSTWEPLYTQNYIDGSSAGGRYIVPSSSATPSAPPRQQGFVQTTLDLSQFGGAAHINPPPASSTATPQELAHPPAQSG